MLTTKDCEELVAERRADYAEEARGDKSLATAANPTQQLIAALDRGPCPSAEDIKALAYALHGTMVAADVPEMLWLNTSFEDMGDAMVKAMRCAEADEVCS